MPEPFKNLLGPKVVADLARHLKRVWPSFDGRRFSSLALDGLDALEMKARMHRLCDALEATLPPSFDEAADTLVAALATVVQAVDDAEVDGLVGAQDDGLAGWAVWPLTEYIARHGRTDVPRALEALHAMTRRFTAEWAIRPLILHDPKRCYATLKRWTRDPSPQVRRLVSEGSRPRLPWGVVLQPLVADPSPTLPLLEALMDDPSPYVRRSVANHLNDIAKDHPDLVEDWVRRHLPGASSAREKLLRHACRTLVKRGHAGVLDAFGVGATLVGRGVLTLSTSRAAVGDSIELRLVLDSTSTTPQRLAIDYAVHHVKANGETSPKVFKGWTLTLAPGESRVLTKRHSLKPVTTRRYFAGRHQVQVSANGRPLAEAAFTLEIA